MLTSQLIQDFSTEKSIQDGDAASHYGVTKATAASADFKLMHKSAAITTRVRKTTNLPTENTRQCCDDLRTGCDDLRHKQ